MYKFPFLLSLLVFPLAASADPSKYEQAVLADKPAAWWRFDEAEKGAGKIASDRVGDADGKFRGAVATVPGLPGTEGHAVRFNGKDAYVQAPSTEALLSNVFSIEFWFRSTQPFKDRFWPGSAAFVSTATPGPNSEDWTIAAGSQQGRDEGRILGKTGPKGRKQSDLVLESRLGDPLNDGHWHHVVFTRTDKGEAKLYVNGELHATDNDSGGNVLNARPLNIGGDAIHKDGAFLDGDMDEVALYTHALNAKRVAAHYAVIKSHLPKRKVRKAVATKPSATEKKSTSGGAPLPFLDEVPEPKARIVEKADSHWAFQPIKKPALPEVQQKSWAKNSIDLFILRKLEKEGRAPAEPADVHALLRRAHFDLLGLPPEPESIEAFLQDPDWSSLLKELLASPHYGERYGRHWLDVARYADSSGRERDYFFPHAARYRDYVIRSMNEDKPFTSFVKEQVAGDILYPEDKPSDERRHATGFYTIGAVYPVSPNAIKRPKRFEYDRLTDAADLTGEAFLGLSFACARCHDHKYDPITQRDYFAFQSLFASSIFKEMPVGKSQAKEQIKDYLLDHSAVAEHATFFERGELSAPVGRMRPRLPVYFSKGKAPVEKAGDHKKRRLQVANWITSEKNPLTARVIANRVWQWHFGEPLVATPNDFGLEGEPPTHPELLDYLATYLMAKEWSLKKLHFHIMSSSTYRMSSAHAGPVIEGVVDRFPTTRMQAETIWDNMLAVSGKLNRQTYGRSVFPPINDDLVQSKRNASWQKEKKESDWMRRGVYVAVKRTIHFPFFDVFNGANSSASVGQRESTIVSPQALTMMNGEIPRKLSAAFHQRLVRECGDDKEKIIALAWLLAYGRPVTEKEKEVTLEFLGEVDMATWCHALFNSNEFVYLQ